ncbi:MAG TPA: sulfatase-like hydrolase/transferase [Verrucomicrobiales bacterium]|nr:sulfatase-like hydrolase/transferase [Verrucomicrobiales bacterium]
MKLLCVLWLALLMVPAFAADRPNIVFLIADDAGWGDCSFNGNSNLSTPSLDRIAKEGAVLKQFFACPLCAPTRAELLTGRWHSRTGVSGVSTGQERLNADEQTLADVFKAAGYATGAFGKWHNGSQWPYHPNSRGFTEYYGFTSGHWGEYFDPPLEHNGEPVRGKGFIADDITSHAIAFIEEHKLAPFLCWLAFNTPHSPWAAPTDDWARFKDKPVTQRAAEGKEDLAETRCALAMMENLDRNAGRVLQKLEELKLLDNTIVIYLSDNGPNEWRWNGGMRNRKGTTDEGGVRAPCFIRWPAGGIKAGTVVDHVTAGIDLLPTLAALTGVPRAGDKPLDGRDLSPILLGKTAAWPDRFIFSHQASKVSARSDQYRLDSDGRLFDIIADPGQKKNLAAELPEVAQKMAAAVAAWRREMPPSKRDDRPFPVGHPAAKRTPLPARDGVPHGGIKRSAPAPNCSYFVNWNKLEDSITWDIEVLTAGDYDVELLYTCPLADAGSEIELSFLDVKLTAKVQPGWDPPLYTNQDTIPRPPAESKMKEFHPLAAGVMHLQKGRSLLTLRALNMPGGSVMDLRQINFIRRQ